MLGKDLYETFFKGYTKKQWGVDPRELPASLLARLPVRFTYDDNYYASKYQGMPEKGYTELVRQMLDHKNIEVRLGSKFTSDMSQEFDHTFFSGPLDSYFSFSLGRMRYRTLDFEKFYDEETFQGNAVINYCSAEVPYTRITEHKFFAPWEDHTASIGYREFSRESNEGDTPYYPLRLEQDKELLSRYVELAHQEEKVTFVGRLGTYRYLDMHVVIGEALDIAAKFLEHRSAPQKSPAIFAQ
jgi:UDP-galactopyranose mutase